MYTWISYGVKVAGVPVALEVATHESAEHLVEQLVQAAWLCPAPQCCQFAHAIVGEAGVVYTAWHRPSTFGYPPLLVCCVATSRIKAYTPKRRSSGVVGVYHCSWELAGYLPVLCPPQMDDEGTEEFPAVNLGLGHSKGGTFPAAGSGSKGLDKGLPEGYVQRPLPLDREDLRN